MTNDALRAAARLSMILCVGMATSAFAQSASDAARGRTLFSRTCAACHGANGAGSAIAPPLSRVLGRQAGTTRFNYSPAMKNARVVWNAVALENYLKSPIASIPGSRMPIGVAQAKDRSDIIAFLATLR
jgi:cytochrome c2